MELKEGIQHIYPLQDVELNKLISIAEKMVIRKDAIIIDQNRTNKFIYFLATGTCRIFYPKQEKEIILDFSFPGDFILPLNSYVHGTATYEIVESMEACEIYRISIDKIQHLYET